MGISLSIEIALKLVIGELGIQITKMLSGQLLSDEQIKSVSKHATGKYFSSLLPEDKETLEQNKKIESARQHIESASEIMSEIRDEIHTQEESLKKILNKIEEKKLKKNLNEEKRLDELHQQYYG